MDFMGAGSRQGFYQEDEHMMINGMLPFSSNSSSSSPSSSSTSHHYQEGQSMSVAAADGAHRWDSRINNYYYQQRENQQQQQQQQRPKTHEEMSSSSSTLAMSLSPAAATARRIIMKEGGASSSAGTIRTRAGERTDWEEGGAAVAVPVGAEREHMFDKVVTPSDVGKLNRLVIPKQHAEKYFPLDSSTNEKGLLLNFEDRSGKPWRFRYSYWNSSQSYVMTKGWSRFVKDKRLDAGDIVSFHRGVGDAGKDRLYIDWRRRPDAPPPVPVPVPLPLPSPLDGAIMGYSSLFPSLCPQPPHFGRSPSSSQLPWTPMFWRPPPASAAAGLWDQQPQLQPAANLLSGSVGGHPNYDQTLLGRHHQEYRNYTSGYYGNSGFCGYDTAAMRPPYASSSPVSNYQLRSAMATNINLLHRQQQQHHPIQFGTRVQLDQDEELGGGGSEAHEEGEPMVFEQVVQEDGKAAASAPKRLRLFGVNMECPIPQSEEEYECDVALSTTNPQYPDTILASQHPHISSSTCSISQLHPLHLSLYHGTPVPHNEGKASAASSSSSLNFDA